MRHLAVAAVVVVKNERVCQEGLQITRMTYGIRTGRLKRECHEGGMPRHGDRPLLVCFSPIYAFTHPLSTLCTILCLHTLPSVRLHTYTYTHLHTSSSLCLCTTFERPIIHDLFPSQHTYLLSLILLTLPLSTFILPFSLTLSLYSLFLSRSLSLPPQRAPMAYDATTPSSSHSSNPASPTLL